MDRKGKKTLDTGETIIYADCDEDHKSGVVIVLSRKAAKLFTEWNPVSDRIIHTTLTSKYTKIEMLVQTTRQKWANMA